MRDQIIDFLSKELVGPDPIPPLVQANGEEILENDSPTVRYGVGVLFPRQTPNKESEREDSDEAPDDSQVEDSIDTTALPEPQKTACGHVDFSIDDTTEEAIGLANAFKPSAMGVSFLAEISTNALVVDVEAGKYRTESSIEDGREKRRFLRSAISGRRNIEAEELRGVGARTLRYPVSTESGEETGLELFILSRPERVVGEAEWRLITISLINKHSTQSERFVTEKCFFQSGFRVTSPDDERCFIEYPEKRGESLDDEELALRLLYREKKTFAVGHGCAAEWTESGERATEISTAVLPTYDVKPIVPNILPDLSLSMLALSDVAHDSKQLEILNRLCEKYSAWIDEQEREALELAEPLQGAAKMHLETCRQCLARMTKGVNVLATNDSAMLAFRLMNRAMLSQQLHFALPLREWVKNNGTSASLPPVAFPDILNPDERKGKWYPFQLGFILMNIAGLADAGDEDRNIADLIWFPTGGGKTEAYLGLTALTIFLRRLRNRDDAGVVVLMRYTLRLLTAQQFQRAASLICACEKIRNENADRLGEERISIGLWVGGELTPNSRSDAVSSLNKLIKGEEKNNPFVLLRCPWCSAQMGPTRDAGVKGYLNYGTPSSVHLVCPDTACDFSARSFPLPLYVIDEDIYEKTPSLVIGTVDKFAMIVWKPETKNLFGKGGTHHSPPELIVQDELHLISGPLGSMVGLFETVIEEFCVQRVGGMTYPAKIVASTATIRRAVDQVTSLFNRPVFQFPPQALKAGESFFATEDLNVSGRTYVGVHASALSSHVTTQVRVFSALLQAALVANVDEEVLRDPYYTLLCYFNNLRELGHAATLIHADIPEYMKTTVWNKKQIARESRRYINKYLELTSRIDSAEITEALQSLERKFGTGENVYPVDICLATNMISVGVDVPRLGLMCVIGQPKTTSEYIQATSRVGRDPRAPGLVVTIYNTGKPRDRSHYEHFSTYHGTLYKQVEPTSVTPWAIPVRKRALHAILVAMIRILGTQQNSETPNPFPAEELIDKALDTVRSRVSDIDPDEIDEVLTEARAFFDDWSRIMPSKYGGFGSPDASAPLMYPAGSFPLPEWGGRAIATPSSMRSVDRTCQATTLKNYPEPQCLDDASVTTIT
ncbi:MAG: helicase family protein with metal-binding cysteine cluster [Acidobacteria bacterium OLB17]|nr:MAG: helicase family protein with metal-binding cysteine cluster [Acidobacteria bacterium OLB17]MCZ2390508.1 helicase [Acidobacteriota bacterium]